MYRLLIVDDEANIVDGIADLFRESDLPLAQVETAYSAGQALEACRIHPFDIIISDIRMPGMTGLDLLDQIRETHQEAIVIFLTGYADFQYAQRAVQGQAFDYLLKPAEDEELVATVERAISRLSKATESSRRDRGAELIPIELATPRSMTDDSFLRQIQVYITEHLDQDLSLDTLSDKFYVNPSYLSRIFHQQTGEQLSHYIERSKMEAAVSMLKDQRYKIYEIADSIGYRSSNYFAKVFKKTFGMSPHEYRIRIGMNQRW